MIQQSEECCTAKIHSTPLANVVIQRELGQIDWLEIENDWFKY